MTAETAAAAPAANPQVPAVPQAAPPTALTPMDRVKSMLATPAIRARFDDMLGKRSGAFVSSVISAVSANRDLAECEPMSVISAAAVAAAMDLPINPGLGFAHIVPYNGVAQFQIGWKGFVQLAMRSGQYKTINLTPILDGQITRHNRFTGEMEFSEEAKSEKVIGYLLYFKLLNGFEKYFYMTHDQVKAHGMRYSKAFAKGKGRWVEDFEPMALKTVAKLGLSKYGILSIDMQKAIEMDQAEVSEDGSPRYVDSTVEAGDDKPKPAKKKGPSRLQKIIDVKASEPAPAGAPI